MEKVTYNEITLPWLRVFIGAIFIFLGLSATISFLSQGFSGIAFLIVLLFCVGIEITKILLGGDVGFYFALKQPDKALFSALIVFVLVCLSLTAEMFFFSSGNLTDQAKLQTVTGKTTALKQQLESAQTNLANCPSGYVTKCQKPLNAQIERLSKELSSAMGAESEQAAAIGTAKFYELLAKLTGTSQDNLMMAINFLRALLGEVLGLYLTSQFATYRRLKSYAERGYTIEVNQPTHRQPLQGNSSVNQPAQVIDNSEELKRELEQLKNANQELQNQLEKKD